tara:strand:- start:1028 stop:1177 length:150 start_codon:yes stop_codon:yes gene_type:complete
MFAKQTMKFVVVFEGMYYRIKDIEANILVGVIYPKRSDALKDAIHLNNN